MDQWMMKIIIEKTKHNIVWQNMSFLLDNPQIHLTRCEAPDICCLSFVSDLMSLSSLHSTSQRDI